MYIEIICLGLISISLLLQLYHHLRFLMPFAFSKPVELPKFSEPVSVIICARNEEKNLDKNLKLILEQDYPVFEVVVVNNDSLDNTQQVLENYQALNPELKITQAKDNVHFTSGKKYAQTIGIKASKYEHLVFTDADCRPNSKNWLQEVANGFSQGNELVLAYSPYEKRPGLASLLARYETFITGMQYLAYAYKGLAYMGVGRNLAYKKELFFRNRGFATHLHLPSGDDDLFVNETAKKGNYSLVYSKDSFMMSKAKENFGEWFKQKRRHLNTVHRYKKRHQFMLYGLSSGRFLFWMALFFTLITQSFNPILISLFTIRILLVYVTYIRTAKKLGDLDLALLWPILEIQFLVFDLIVYLSVRVSKPRDW